MFRHFIEHCPTVTLYEYGKCLFKTNYPLISSNLSHIPFHMGLPGIISQSQYFMFMKSSVGYTNLWGFIHIRFLGAMPSENAKVLEFTRERNKKIKCWNKRGGSGKAKTALPGEALMVEGQQVRWTRPDPDWRGALAPCCKPYPMKSLFSVI